jgi:hypothetical protein
MKKECHFHQFLYLHRLTNSSTEDERLFANFFLDLKIHYALRNEPFAATFNSIFNSIGHSL